MASDESLHDLPAMCAEALARDADAVEYEGRWYRWAELREVGTRVLAALAQAGVPEDAAIALILRNRPSALATQFALIAAGRTVKMVYPFQSPSAIAANIARLQPAAVIGEEREFSDELRAQMAADGLAGVTISEMDARLLRGAERCSATHCDRGGEPRIEILTSGTTGAPKQFPVPFAMIAQHHVAHYRRALGGRDPSQLPPSTIYAPLGNISGVYTAIAPLVVGIRGALWDRFSLDLWLDYVRRFRPAHSGMPCASLQALLDADVPKEDLASIKAMGMGAAPLDPTLQREFEEKYDIPMLSSYGATEFGGPVAHVTLDDIAEFGYTKRGSVGRAYPGASLRVVDPESGAELAANEEGIVEVVSPRIGPDWLRTSDVGVLDEDGFLWLKGRADAAIMRGGFKVLPESIERALVAHEAVSDAGVVGVPDKRLGEVPGAAVVLKPGKRADQDELEQHIRKSLLATHVPVHWAFLETLPKNASAKIDRLALKQLFAD
jgi:acyl-coenzyme A synthetase/AMP-(fatty) acid ligase